MTKPACDEDQLTTLVKKAPSSVCRRLMPVRLDGNVKKRGPVANRCPGSGLIPAIHHMSIATPGPTPPSAIGQGSASSMSESETLPDINSVRSLADINPGCSYVNILKRIPRGSRVSVARMLSSILHDVVQSNDCVSWERLFLFPCRCLPSPHRGGHRRNLARIVNEAVESKREEIPPSNLISNPHKPLTFPRLWLHALPANWKKETLKEQCG